MFALSVSKMNPAHRTVRLFQAAALLGAATFLSGPLPLQGQSAGVLAAAPMPAFTLSRVDSSVDSSEVMAIPGNPLPAIRNAIDNGRPASATVLGDLIVALKQSSDRRAALRSFYAQQYDPASPEYHRWIEAADSGSGEGGVKSDLEMASDWFKARGSSWVRFRLRAPQSASVETEAAWRRPLISRCFRSLPVGLRFSPSSAVSSLAAMLWR